jgi:transketolase
VESQIRTPAAAPSAGLQRMVPAYTRALLAMAEQHSTLVALDADLVLDTGLIPFRERYPERFVECGIAEQDMVSMAGGMALRGHLPVVHSFACFLSSRPNEQIYNNASERTKIVYVGSLAGVVPGGPGHSHQAVRDISALAGMPGMVLLEPSCEREVEMALSHCVNSHSGPSYLRLVSIPCDVPYELPADYRMEPGRGIALTEGSDALLFTYGPVMLPSAWRAAQQLVTAHGVGLKVVNLPWLNVVDAAWLAALVRDYHHVIALDNHYVAGGQGDHIASALAGSGLPGTIRLHRWGIGDIPPCGTNDEILAALKLDTQGIADRVVALLRDAPSRR